MKLLFTTLLLLFGIALSGQYNYGLEVDQQDAKIEGRLYLEDEHGNTYIGANSGRFSAGTGNASIQINTVLGTDAGANITNGNGSTLIGAGAGANLSIGSQNTFIGVHAGEKDTGTGNVYLGSFAGFYPGQSNQNRNSNIFIGKSAGAHETGSRKLYIDINPNLPDNLSPLIYGEFDNDLIRINGALEVTETLHISETAKLEPQSTVPTCGANDLGLMYVDANDSKLYLCKGALGWKEVMVSP